MSTCTWSWSKSGCLPRCSSPSWRIPHPKIPCRTSLTGCVCRSTSGSKEGSEPPGGLQTSRPPEPSLGPDDRVDWGSIVGTLFASGFLTGPLLDGIHSRVGLQVYDLYPIVIGGLQTSLLVPPVLGLFYVVLGLLYLLLDNRVPGQQTTQARARAEDVGKVAMSFGALALMLQLSAILYSAEVPYWQVHLVLAAVGLTNWRMFDYTAQGLVLALVCGVGAPLCELVLLGNWDLWHYPQADMFGIVSWVVWCYFFYTPAVGNLARCLYMIERYE